MTSLVVLGLVPGTNIQISFTAWLLVFTLFPYFHKYLWEPKLEAKVKAGAWESLMVVMWALMLMPGLHHWPPYATPGHRQAL